MKKLSDIVFLFINYLLVLLLLLSYLSVYISPSVFAPLAFFGLAYHYILSGNLLLIIYWIIRGKKQLLLSLVTILIGFGFLQRTISLPPKFQVSWPNSENYVDKPSENAVPDTIKFLTYNVRVFNLWDWTVDITTSDSIIGFVNRMKPSIIAFQEFYTHKSGNFTPDNLQRSLANTPYSHIHYIGKNKNGPGHGIATYSAYPIINKGSIVFENTTNICIYTDIVIKNDTIRVYNNHLQSMRFRKRNYSFMDTMKMKYSEDNMVEIKDISLKLKDAFVERAKQVNIISAHIKNSPYKVIVCGDFNDTPVSYAYQKMSRRLRDAFIASGKGMGFTYIGIFPSYRIDYILHSPRIRSINFKTHGQVKLSDHFPLTCDFLFY